MQETMQALRGLQELDEDIFRVKQELDRLPRERDQRRAGIDLKRQSVAVIDQELFGLRMRIKEIEDLTTVHRQRIRKLEGEINESRDGAVIAACQHEIRSLKREIGEADDEGLGFVESADTLEARKAELVASIEQEEALFAEYDGNVQSELADAQRRLDELQAQRAERMSSDLEPDVLSQYERLLEAREGVALAALQARICQGCYMSVPANVYVRLSQGRDLVRCPSCDRILYLDD